MNLLVVPTIRKSSIVPFLHAWQGQFDRIILIEDNAHKTFEVDGCLHLCWEDIDKDLGDSAWIISRRDSAIRSYGFWKALQYSPEVIYTLDDDCLPISGEHFAQAHLEALTASPKWTSSVPGVRVRGLPYQALGTLANVKLSVGLWQGVPDFDAISTLSGQCQTITLPPTRILPADQYTPICGMNMAFLPEFAPLAYFPLMGMNSPFGRFDDIWFGVIAKKICDHLGWHISMGKPYIHHSRASDPFANLVKEAPGIAYHERFWRYVDGIALSESTAKECVRELGRKLPQIDDYLTQLGRALEVWASLF